MNKPLEQHPIAVETVRLLKKHLERNSMSLHAFCVEHDLTYSAMYKLISDGSTVTPTVQQLDYLLSVCGKQLTIKRL